jgi:hypothetical protein
MSEMRRATERPTKKVGKMMVREKRRWALEETIYNLAADCLCPFVQPTGAQTTVISAWSYLGNVLLVWPSDF